MVNRFFYNSSHIHLAMGPTDFRLGITGLVNLVQSSFKLDPYEGSEVFVFCNKRRNSLKVLRYDQNGFVLLQKKLMGNMKYQWPKQGDGTTKVVSKKQMEWLLDGLEMEPKRRLSRLEITAKNSCY